MALMFSIWRFGRQSTWLRLAPIALCAGAALTVKYSGILVGPFVILARLSLARDRQNPAGFWAGMLC